LECGGPAPLCSRAERASSRLGFAQKDPGRIGVKNYFSRKGRKDAKKTSENAVALCAFAPLREKYPRQKTLFVQT